MLRVAWVVRGSEWGVHLSVVGCLVKNIKGFSVKAKSLRNTATCQKLWREVPSILLLYHTLQAEATFSRYELACEK